MKLKKLLSVLLALALLTALLPASALALVPDDEYVDDQWGLEAIHAFEAWDAMPAGAQPVTVAVMDGGFDLTHEDLAGCYYRDKKGNIVQYDAVDNDFDVPPDSHGTHVAGIIAAVAGNAVGVAGVTGNHAKILPVQVLTAMSTGGDAYYIEGYRFILDYARLHPEANIRVVSMSIGGDSDSVRRFSNSDFADFVNEAYEMGILTVLSAGNVADAFGYNGYMNYPSDWAENAVSVIALDRGENGVPVRKDWSNYNMPGQRTKDLSAPGVDILSTYWESDRGNEAYGQPFYDYLSGTSMAAPCVAGVAALMFAANPNLTAAEVKEILCATAQPIHADEGIYENGFSLEYGWGMVDAAAAVAAAAAALRGHTALLEGKTSALVPVTAAGLEQDPGAWTWSSSNEAVATVAADGVVTGRAPGEADITATRGGLSATKRVTVYRAAISGADEAAYGTVVPLKFTSDPVRDEWILTAGPDGDAVRCDLCASTGDGEALRLFAAMTGTVSVTATLATDDSVKVTHSVGILPADISGAEIRVENQPRTGAPAEPKVRFHTEAPEDFGHWKLETWDSLKKDVDYELTWENNAALGTGTVTLTGIGRFTGKVQKEFSIKSDYIIDADVELDVGACVYDGTAHTPAVTVTHGGAALTENTDYRVDYADNVDAGTAGVTVQGIGDWAGTVVRTFEIAPADISDRESFGAYPIPNQPYGNGERLKPGVDFADMRRRREDGDYVRLEAGVDYKLTWANNVGVKNGAVTASMTVTGIGNYTGERAYTFVISDKVVTLRDVVFDVPEGGFVYSGEAYTPAFTVTYQGEELIRDRDYQVYGEYNENINAGLGYIWIQIIGDEYAGWCDPEKIGYSLMYPWFEIAPADIADVEIAAVAAQVYTGAAVEPEIAAEFNGMTLVAGEDYELSYADNVYPGTARVTVTGLGNYDGERTLTFSIVAEGGYDADPAPATPEKKDEGKKDDEKKETPSAAYTDVPADAWYASDVAFVTEAGLFEGFGDGTFGPEQEMDRAMAVQVLWKLAGKPGVDLLLPFDDVSGNDWFCEAVRWACAEGISDGTGEGFDPTAPITREQFATMVYRFLQASGKGFEGLWAFRLDYTDAGDVSDWAREGMSWLVMNGILKGMGDGTLAPQGVLTRAQTAALMHRIADLLEAES